MYTLIDFLDSLLCQIIQFLVIAGPYLICFGLGIIVGSIFF